MGNKIDEFYELLKKDRKLSEYSKEKDYKVRAEELKGEVDEIIEAIQKNDFDNLKEELGDALWDLLCLYVIAEEEGRFTREEILDDVIKKYHRRKPFIKEGKSVSVEEELRIWNEVKKKEKLSKKPL